MQKKIAPSILSIDFSNLKYEIEKLNKSKCDLLHIDIMDGVFVNNISFGTPILNVISKFSIKPIEVHLMIINPEYYFNILKKNKVNNIIVHYEICHHLHKTICIIKEMGMQAGVAINPHTPINLLNDIIYDIDIITLMSVNPGFGGQKFIKQTYSKIENLKKLILKKNLNTLIEVDGGVNMDNIQLIVKKGADILVIGNAIFSNKNTNEIISNFKAKIQ